jgi:tetratricopeptide (TPR) repeat protein
VAEIVEEIRFYLENSMPDQASTALGKLEKLTTDPAMLSAMRAEIEIAAKAAPAEPEIAVVESAEPESAEPEIVEEATAPMPEAVVEEVAVEAPSAPVAEAKVSTPPVEPPAPKAAAKKAATEPAPQPAPGVLNVLVADLESSLGDNFLPDVSVQEAAPAPPVAQLAPKPELQKPAALAKPSAASKGKLDELVSDLETSLGDSFLPEAPVPNAVPQPAVRPAVASTPVAAVSTPAAMSAAAGSAGPSISHQPTAPTSTRTSVDPAAGIDLAGMFGELKHELEEDTATADEDPETHYSLGVAFREMGLLDEAIGELQKVCQAVERGHAFPSLMQTYTWLAQCFIDKGVPEAAVRWYESALKLPNLDGETLTALHYELASAYEGSGDKAAALTHFMKVYGSNIDYRDVAERIKALKS